MIWATVSSQSCFCWGYRASPSLAANNIINLISVLTIWWCPRIESCVVGRGCLLWPVCSLGKSLLAFDLFHFVLQGQIWLLLQVSLELPTFAFQSHIMKRTSLLVVSCKRSYLIKHILALHCKLKWLWPNIKEAFSKLMSLNTWGNAVKY